MTGVCLAMQLEQRPGKPINDYEGQPCKAFPASMRRGPSSIKRKSVRTPLPKYVCCRNRPSTSALASRRTDPSAEGLLTVFALKRPRSWVHDDVHLLHLSDLVTRWPSCRRDQGGPFLYAISVL